MTMKFYCVVAIFTSLTAAQTAVSADVVANNNQAKNPPLVDASKDNCSVDLLFKSAPISEQEQHAYLVITRPDGTKTEVRGGPQRGPGSSSGSGEQRAGNPFSCSTEHKLGVVVPYIGKHGVLGKDSAGNQLHSPDGKVTAPTKALKIKVSAQKNICDLANCVMQAVKASGQSCKEYILGTSWMRNSNTIISTALASCGVSDPRPSDVSAPGWGEPWFRN